MPQEVAWQQAHVDIGALAQRVTGLESGMTDLRSAITDLSKKLDSKPTNWWAVIGGLTAVLSVIGTAIGMLISPINYTIERHEREIRVVATDRVQDTQRLLDHTVPKTQYDRDHDEQERWIASLRDRLRYDEDRGVYKDDLVRVDKTREKLTEGTASKAELADDARRTDERLNALSADINELRRDIYSTRASAPPAR